MSYIVGGIILILVIFAAVGFWRGIIRTVIGLVSVVLALAATYFVTPMVSDFIIQNTSLYENVEKRIYDGIEKNAENKVKDTLKDVGVKDDDTLKTLTDEQVKMLLEVEPDKAAQVQIIDELELPEDLKTMLIENNNDTVYSDLGVTSFYKYISGYTAQLIIRIISYCLVFIAIRILLMIIVAIIGRALEFSPILSTANRVGGMIFGLFVGLIVVWLLMFGARYVFASDYTNMIESNLFLQKLEEYNMVEKVFMELNK